MAKLQKRKSLNDKIKKRVSAPEDSSSDNNENEKKNSFIALSPRVITTAIFKNTKDMTAQTVIE